MTRPAPSLLPYTVALACLAFGVHDRAPQAAERGVERLAGTYAGPERTWTVEAIDGRLGLRGADGVWIVLEPLGERTWRAPTVPPLTLRFEAEAGRIVGCRIARGERATHATRR